MDSRGEGKALLSLLHEFYMIVSYDWGDVVIMRRGLGNPPHAVFCVKMICYACPSSDTGLNPTHYVCRC